MVGRSNLTGLNLASWKVPLVFSFGVFFYGLVASYPHLWIFAVPLELMGLVIILFGQVKGRALTPFEKAILLATYRVLIILMGTPWLVGSFQMMYPSVSLFASIIACYFIGYVICAGVFLSYVPLVMLKRSEKPLIQFLLILLLMIVWEYGVYIWPASTWLSLGFTDYTVKVFYLFGHNGTKFVFILMKAVVLFGLTRGFLNYRKSVTAVTVTSLILVGIANLVPSGNYSSDRAVTFSLVQEGQFSARGQPLADALAIVERVKADLNKDLPDIVVWPENFFVGPEPTVNEVLRNLQAAIPTQHVAGSTGFTNSGYRSTVDSILNGDIQRQMKGTAFPIGEYVPFLSLWQSLGLLPKTQLNMETSWDLIDFNIGKHPDVKFLGLVCLDAFNPWLIAHRVAGIKGETKNYFFIEIYNETLFGTPRASRQHLALMRIMSASFRMPMIHAGQAGVSAVINADGSVKSSMPYGENGILKDNLFF